MDGWLGRSGLDRRFVDFTILMLLGVWPWLLVSTLGFAGVFWWFVLICQMVALPFAIVGWSAGYRTAVRSGMPRRSCAMVAGWIALVMAEIGLALVLVPWMGTGAIAPGLWAFPMLAVLVTGGVLWFYRDETWPDDGTQAAGTES